MGPCLCGDTYCPSCGPAQGNIKCDACGRWSWDGFYRCTGCDRVFEDERPDDHLCDKCGHELEEDSGCFNPEACEKFYIEECRALAEEYEAAKEFAEELAKELEGGNAED